MAEMNNAPLWFIAAAFMFIAKTYYKDSQAKHHHLINTNGEFFLFVCFCVFLLTGIVAWLK